MGRVKSFLFGKRIESGERIHHFLILIIRTILLLAFAFSVYEKRWTLLFMITLNFLITFLPKLFEKKYKINIPIEFEILVLVFVFASLFLGEVKDYYLRYWWWDVVLHVGSGVALGFVGFIVLYVLYKGDKINAKPFTIAFFSFCFAMALGAVWEIFEFAMDQFFGLSMQKSGLIDTMWDLIVDGIGAVFASAIGYLYLKRGEVFFVDKIINRFVKENPALFEK
ncbi:MAG: hypothetical protein KJ600_04055 [Nanoarchaeota archaeon]|nr:hypothetical protein [Nanoarchaeota archaeon]MBU1103701.1 hypothetical protein [Nanoarchaeota archaeon]